MYDPLVGRFLSPDNVIQSPDNTQNYNRYTYCLNNPLKYNDPSGWLMCPGSGGFTYSPTNQVDFGGHSSEELNNNNGGGGWGGNGGGVLPFDYGTIYNTWFGYSDWKKSCSDNTYRGSYSESNARYWSRVLYAVSNKEVSAVIFGGSRTNRYQDLLGFNYTDGSSYYYSDNANSNLTTTSGGGSWLETANNYSGVATTFITSGIETANAIIRSQFKSATSWTEWANLRNSQQAWRTANVLGKTGAITLKITGATGGILCGLSASYSTYKVINQAYNGGLQSVNGWDVADATVGWAGTASAAALILGASNPVGWAIIGIGAAGYGAFRAGQYIYENY